MSADANFESFTETVKTIVKPDHVWTSLKDFAKDFGIDALTYYHVAPPGSADFSEKYFVALGYAADFASKHQQDLILFGNPLICRLNPMSEPILWSELFEKITFTDDQKHFFKEFYFDSKSEGLAIPVYGPGGRDGFIMLRFANPESEMTRINTCLLSLASYVSHVRFCRLRVNSPETSVRLTAREQEVLKWVARGKSNTVIADIVGISQHTVNGYLRRIYLKTRTSDRTSAALRAVADVLIEY